MMPAGGMPATAVCWQLELSAYDLRKTLRLGVEFGSFPQRVT